MNNQCFLCASLHGCPTHALLKKRKVVMDLEGEPKQKMIRLDTTEDVCDETKEEPVETYDISIRTLSTNDGPVTNPQQILNETDQAVHCLSEQSGTETKVYTDIADSQTDVVETIVIATDDISDESENKVEVKTEEEIKNLQETLNQNVDIKDSTTSTNDVETLMKIEEECASIQSRTNGTVTGEQQIASLANQNPSPLDTIEIKPLDTSEMKSSVDSTVKAETSEVKTEEIKTEEEEGGGYEVVAEWSQPPSDDTEDGDDKDKGIGFLEFQICCLT